MSYEQLMESVNNLAVSNAGLKSTVQAVQTAAEASRDSAEAFAANALSAVSDVQAALLDASLLAGQAAVAKIDEFKVVMAGSDGADDLGATLNSATTTVQQAINALSKGSRISTTAYGVPTGNVSAVDKLQELINLDRPIWIDGNHLIDKSLTLKNTDMIGPGMLNIVSDANFQVTVANFQYNDSAIAMPTGLGPQWKVNLKFRVEFRNSVATKPHTPFRFVGLVDSVIDLDYEGWGSGDVTQTNFPDPYFWNNRVSIRGKYVVHHRQVDVSLGGFWVRDVYLGTDPGRITTSVVIEDGTYIEHDGKDEALSFFNPAGGTYRNCGVKAATLVARKVGLSFLNYSGNSKPASDCSGFANNTRVTLSGIGNGQAVVKSDYTAPSISNVKAFITGIDDITAGSVLAACFRNSNPRSDGEFPRLDNCTAYVALGVQPTRELRAYDGPMINKSSEYYATGVAKFTYGHISDARGTIIGGRMTGALTFDISNVDRAVDCSPTLWQSIKYTALRLRRGETVVTPDASGVAQIQHSIGVDPIYRSVSLINATTRMVHVTSSDLNYLYILVNNPATGAADTSGTPRRVCWSVEG